MVKGRWMNSNRLDARLWLVGAFVLLWLVVLPLLVELL
jgi:hypothetical protein